MAHRAVLLNRVPQVGVRVDKIAVASTVLGPRKDTGLVEMGDQPLGASFRDADAISHFTQSCIRVFREAHENMRVVARECPVRFFHVIVALPKIQGGRILRYVLPDINNM